MLWSCKSIDIAQPVLNETDPIITHSTAVSKLSIPIEIGMQNQLKEVEKKLPMNFEGKDDRCEGVSFSYKFIREPVDFQLNKSDLYYEVNGRFELKLNYCPKCHGLWGAKESCVIPRLYASCGVGEPMRRVKVGYNTAISLTPDYKFNAETKLKMFKVLDPCEITVFHYNATAQVEEQVKGELKALEKEIDKQIEAVDIQSSIKKVWCQLEEPVDLSGYGLLYMKPKTLALSPVTFDKQNNLANLTAELGLEPIISTDKEEVYHSTLPKQSTYSNQPGFLLSVLVKASYDSINKQINKELMGYKIPIKRKLLIVDSVQIIGHYNQKLFVKVCFSGTRHGVFFLSGTPEITREQFLVVSDLAYDVKTKSVLLKTAKWIFDKRILGLLSTSSKFDLKPFLTEATSSINQHVNTTLDEGVYLSGSIDKLLLSGLQLGTTGLFLNTEVSGNLKLKIK
jgi:hypothetical protein